MYDYTVSLFSSTDGQVTTEASAKTCFLAVESDWPSGSLCYFPTQECVGLVIRFVPSSTLTSARVSIPCMLALGRKSSFFPNESPLHGYASPVISAANLCEMSFAGTRSYSISINVVFAWICGKNQGNGSTFSSCLQKAQMANSIKIEPQP